MPLYVHFVATYSRDKAVFVPRNEDYGLAIHFVEHEVGKTLEVFRHGREDMINV